VINRARVQYAHTQRATLLYALMVPAALFSLGMGIWAPEPAARWISLGTFAFLALLTIAFGSLTVTVDDEALVFHFGPGVHRRRFLLREIVSARPVRNSPLYGWGIRLTPHGWLYNVSGLDAVELTLASGRRLRIGTDDPEGLLGALGLRG
jgi:hypothetical protein